MKYIKQDTNIEQFTGGGVKVRRNHAQPQDRRKVRCTLTGSEHRNLWCALSTLAKIRNLRWLKPGFRMQSFPVFRMVWVYMVQKQWAKSCKKLYTSYVIWGPKSTICNVCLGYNLKFYTPRTGSLCTIICMVQNYTNPFKFKGMNKKL